MEVKIPRTSDPVTAEDRSKIFPRTWLASFPQELTEEADPRRSSMVMEGMRLEPSSL